MCMNVADTSFSCSACRGQKRVLDPLGPEFQMDVGLPVGAGIEQSPVEEQPALCTTEPSLQSHSPFSIGH